MAASQIGVENLKVRRAIMSVTVAARAIPLDPVEKVVMPAAVVPPAEPEMTLAVAEPIPQPEIAPLAPEPEPAVQPVALPSPKPAAPPRPAVTVGAFAAVTAAAVEPRREIRAGGFDTDAAVAVAPTTRTAAVGAFDARVQAADARPGTDVKAVVSTGFDRNPTPAQDRATGRVIANAGFGAASTVAAGPATGRVVSNAGFGSGGSSTPAKAIPTGTVRAGGFEATSAPVAASAPKVVQTGTPVEVLFKPTPAYTEAARSAKVEGEVVLEVEFLASGHVRVARVIRGLGYGLDEMAIRAAEQIRFKAALNGGRPVDHRAHVNIVFRLT